MVAINKISIKGFKSFAKRTEIPLGRNFNCILGPNGSGKSNVCDAICFVLGKLSAKGLRAEKTANLIFHGGKDGSPAKEAEVSIFFDNTSKKFSLKDKEIKISRVVKKTGQSTYLINDEVRTRQQVLDLLASANIDPEGHNIVLQGDIIRFVQMKSEERRELIEEIAGIAVFEEKKDKAMKELEKVQDKLNEADIILSEREKTLSDLKKDRDQALKFKELEKNINRNKATSLHLQIKEKNEKKERLEAELNKYKKNAEHIQESINNLKALIEQKRNEIESINKELKEKGDKEQQDLHSKIGNIKEEIVRESTRKDVCENEIKKINERTRQLQKNLSEVSKSVSDLAKRKSSIANELAKLKEKEKAIARQVGEYKEKHGIGKGHLQSSLEEIEKAIDECEKYLQEAEYSRQEAIRDKDKVLLHLENIEKKLESYSQLKKEDKERAKRLKQAKAEFKEVAKELSKRLNESSVFSVQLANARNKLMDKNEELSKLRARSIGIKEIAAGDIAVKKIKSMNLQGVFGTVGELGQVNSKYALALEVAAGSRLRSVVVSNDSVAAKCIQILKENKTGVVTFLPLNKLKERIINTEAKNLKGKPGVHGLAIDLVSYDPKFKNVFKYTFGSTVVVDDLTTARRLGIGRARMVSLEGDLIEPSGAMIGGYRRKSGLGFREKELESGIASLEKEIERLSKEIELLEKRKTENEESIISLREKKALLETKIKGSENIIGSAEDAQSIKKEKKGMEKKLQAIEKELAEIEKDCNNYRAKLAGLKSRRAGVVDNLSKASDDQNSPLSKLEDERIRLRESGIKLESESEGITRQLEMLENERQKTDSILNSHRKELENFKSELSSLIISVKELKISLKEKEAEQKRFYSEYQSLFVKRTKLEKQIQKAGVDIVRQEERSRSFENRANDMSVKIALINGELEGLKKEFENHKDIPLRRGVSLGELNIEIRSFEDSLRKMGNVNLRALEIYEKVHEEYKVLLGKYDKLKLEKEDVLKLMYEIESKKKTVFIKTFKAVEKKFKEIFSMLYQKAGEADLAIENEEDPFNGGVDIRVKIANKKYMDINSLSGGEKTLVALAFIFAIQEFNPAAFYLLDEVDAALDKKNSELLSKLISKYAKKAQYIVISHNDSLINEADYLYGVSMQDGISKIISLKV